MRVEGRRIEEKQRPQDDGTWRRKRVGLKKKKNKVGNENEKTSRVTFPKRYFFFFFFFFFSCGHTGASGGDGPGVEFRPAAFLCYPQL
jgi:hypothetical protein